MNKDHLTAALRELFLLESRDVDHVLDKYKQSLGHYGVRGAITAALHANPNLIWSEIDSLMKTITGDMGDAVEIKADVIVPQHDEYTFTVEEWVLAQGITAYVDLINLGKSVAQTYRRTRTVDPNQAYRTINGLDIKVNVYRAADVSLIQIVANKFMPEGWSYGAFLKKSSLQEDSLRES